MAPPAVVLLDVNETLVSFDGLRPRFPRPEMVELWLAATLRDGIGLSAAGDHASFVAVGRGVLLGMLGGDEQAADHVLAGLDELRLHGDVVAGLQALAQRGARVVAYTNGSAEQTRGWLERGGAEPHVDDCLSVEEVRRWKPAAEAYEWVLGRLGADPQQTALIAVHPWDLNGASHVGIRTAWLNRTGVPWPDVFAEPEFSAPHLPALADAIFS